MFRTISICAALPSAPENVQVSEITATSVKLTWSYKGADQLAYYVIQHKPKHANQAYAEISGITTMYYQVRSLSPYTEYEFFVIAVNDIGRGPASTPVLVTTGETSQYLSFSFPSSFSYFLFCFVGDYGSLEKNVLCCLSGTFFGGGYVEFLNRGDFSF